MATNYKSRARECELSGYHREEVELVNVPELLAVIQVPPFHCTHCGADYYHHSTDGSSSIPIENRAQ